MPKETKEQKAARLALEEQERLAQLEEFRRSVPKRLMDAQALAHSLNVHSSVTLTSTGPKVSFRNEDPWIDCDLTYECEQWALESLEDELSQIKTERDARLVRQKLALEAFSKLTPDERRLIKEFIYMLPL